MIYGVAYWAKNVFSNHRNGKPNFYQDIPYTTIVKGDGKFMSIAAASILAKTHRDEYMERIARDYPQYQWSKNKGYPTKEHRVAILEHGITEHHRRTFGPCLQPSLFDEI